MKTVCEPNKCVGCKACVEACSKKAITLVDNLEYQYAIINESECIHCELCHKVCQVANPLPLRSPLKWYQGWAADPANRIKSSSGGFAYSLAEKMIMDSGHVVSCKFEKGEFKYSLATTLEELDSFRESKYVKSDPEGIYSITKRLLDKGKAVLFIGLPCHVAGLKKYINQERQNLITVDLICHGSPSPKLLEMFLNQYGYSLQSIDRIHFRQKSDCSIAGKETVKQGSELSQISFTEPGIKDRYTLAFLNALIYTNNCYECRYAGCDRVSDITIGDSWGSELDEWNKENGISLAICQTEKGLSFLENCQLELHEVNVEKAVEANHQLREPCQISSNREMFFYRINKGNSFNRAVRSAFPQKCFRLDLKNLLIKLGFIKSHREGIEFRIVVESK